MDKQLIRIGNHMCYGNKWAMKPENECCWMWTLLKDWLPCKILYHPAPLSFLMIALH